MMDLENKRGKSKLLTILGMFLVTITSVVFFVFVIICCVLFLNPFLLNDENEIESHQHQYYEYNPKTEDSTYGIVSILPKYEKNEFESYTNQDGNYVLISGLGSQEFMCTGSCFCDERRTSQGYTLSKGIFYLLAAVSSTIAYREAREYFQKECEYEHSDTCSFSSIQSDVDSCQNVQEAEEGGLEGEVNNNEVVYWCHGSCEISNHLDDHPIEMYLADEFGCEELGYESEIKFVNPGGLDDDDLVEFAKRKFKSIYLDDFCKDQSKHEYQGRNEDGTVLDSSDGLFLCNSSKSVSCRRIPSNPSK